LKALINKNHLKAKMFHSQMLQVW